MEFVNNPAERETERKEKLLNEKAIAALIAADMEEIGDAKPSMSSTMLIKSVVLPIPARLNETKEELKDDIAGVDQLPDALADLCLDYQENPAPLEEKIEKKIEKYMRAGIK